MTACGICGTDLHVVKGEWQRPTPMVLGHEGAGVVEAVGEGVEALAPGDEVVLSWAPSCRECPDCRRGRPAACMSLQYAIAGGTLLDGETGMRLDGETLYRGTATGALVRAAGRLRAGRAAAGGSGVPLEEAALLGCAALTGVGAVLFAAGVEPGSTVLVVGAGGVGQFVVQGARIAGAAEIVCVDPLEERLELVQRLGATQVAQPDGLAALMKESFPDGVDYAFDAVGDPATTKTAFRWTRNAGLTVIVGLPALGRDARARSHGVRPPGEGADGNDLWLRGSGRRAAHPAWSTSAPARSISSHSSAPPSRSTTPMPLWKRHWPASRAASSSSREAKTAMSGGQSQGQSL